MRGVILGLFLVATACSPAKNPADSSATERPPGGARTDEPPESWGSSETAEAAHTKPPSSPAATTMPSVSTPTSSGARPSAAPDSGPHVPSDLGGPAYDRPELEVTLTRAARQVNANCGAATDDTGAATGPWGKTTVTVKLGRNGHSRGGTVPAPYDGKAVGRCAVSAFKNLIYAPFAGSDVDVDWPVELKKP